VCEREKERLCECMCVRVYVGMCVCVGVYVGGVSITCTGELISATWMMTAAHCLLNSGNTGYRQPVSLSCVT